MCRRRRVLRKKKVMMVVYWEKPFSAKKGNVQVPWRKEFLNQFPRNLHITGYQAFMKITMVLGITNLNTINSLFSLIMTAL
jgi:hypothetical protein